MTKTVATWCWVERRWADKTTVVSYWRPTTAGPQVEVEPGDMVEVHGKDGTRTNIIAMTIDGDGQVEMWRLADPEDHERLDAAQEDQP